MRQVNHEKVDTRPKLQIHCCPQLESVREQIRTTQNDTFFDLQYSIFVEVWDVALPDDGRDLDVHPPIRIGGRPALFPLREEREP